MCGIAGALTRRGVEPAHEDRLRDMAAVLRHRGPDGWGIYQDQQVGMVHTRLSIIDLATGDQPLTNEDGTVWLSFNGEIFNYVELRRELTALGHRFSTTSDSEVIVHAYEAFGEDAWRRFNGQFAFALWDRRAEQLWLVRDQMGILPLHYSVRGDHLIFGSEAKALFASGLVAPQPSAAGLAQVFTFWSALSPTTVFDGVQTVRPGTALRVDANLTATEQRWWQPDMSTTSELAALPVEEAASQLGARLQEAVDLRLRADVPVGAYLSGGLDSSVISSLVQRGEAPLETFAIRFEDPHFDETAEQRQMAKLLGTRHHELVCTHDRLARSLAETVWHCETPLLRTAPVPLFLLSALVRDSQMKVVLTGEGADELLAGYSIFKEDAIRRFWARQPGSTARPALLARLHPEVAAGGARDTEIWQKFFGHGLQDTGNPWYSHMIRWRNTGWATRMLAQDIRAEAESTGPPESALVSELPSGWGGWDPLARAQWLEIATFMSPYLLGYQGDRVAMAHGVEVRYPFLDPEVIRWSSGLPRRLKLPGLRDKTVLRRLASRSLPQPIWQRPKQPYRAPTSSALFGPTASDEVRDLLADDAVEDLGLLAPRSVRTLVSRARAKDGHLGSEREEMALVGALTVQMWGHQYLRDMSTHVATARKNLDTVKPSVEIRLAS